MKTVRLRIAGRVQGIGYRAWAIETAQSLGLRGWVRNRGDGTVELLAAGEPQAIAAMIEGCRQGPPGACVREVRAADAQDDGSPGFAARPSA